MSKIKDYLQDIYGLQSHVAGLNKPLMTIAPGHSFNSGATLLAASNLPMTTLDSKVAFNECQFGFVPHAGATFYLSRLPGEMGTFLSLTGKSIHGVDAMKLNLSEGIVHKPNDYEYHVGDVIYSQEVHQHGGPTMFRTKE